MIDKWAGGASPIEGASLNTDTKKLITNSAKASMEKLIAYDKGAEEALGGGFNIYEGKTIVSPEWGGIFDKDKPTNPAADASIYTGTLNTDKMKKAEPSITLIFNQINAAVSHLTTSALNYESTYEDNLYASHAVYKNMITKLSNTLTTLPPSGAIAGVYAMVDSNRGVWKAPANVSLAGVVGLTETIDSKEQEELNVDVVAGKSINAIRAFTGKGVLVWGARDSGG
jgi:Bacteriophage tail sheath protein